MNIYYIIVIVGVFISSCSQLLLKQSATKEHGSFLKEYLNWRVILSYTIFLAVTFTNIIALKYGVQLKDMPILESLGYLFVPLLSFLILSEKVNKRTVFAMILIFSGIIVFYQ